jgi:hypothetical protein
MPTGEYGPDARVTLETHMPATHMPVAQTVPHDPQFIGSKFVPVHLSTPLRGRQCR